MTQESTSKVKIKFSKKLIVAILIILCIPVLMYVLPKYVLPIYTWPYAGRSVSFRANLRDAQKVPITTVYGGNDSDVNIMEALVRDDVQNITFVFKPTDSKGNSLYIVEETEIIKALTFAYLFSTDTHTIPNFTAVAVDSYSNITSTNINPKIVLISPNFGNETVVKQDIYIIYVEAKNTSSFNSNKAEFDLATVRLMMAILSIKI